MPQFPAIGAFGAFRAEDELADNCAIYAVGAAHEFTNLVNGKPPVLGGTGASVASAYGPHGGALSTGGNANGFVTLGEASDFAVGTGDFSAAICIRKGSLVNSFGFVVAGHIEILIGEGGNSTWVRWRQNNATFVGGTMFVPDVEDYQMFVYSRQNGVESHWMNGVLQFRDTIGPLNLTPASGMVIGKRGNTATYYTIPGIAMTGFWRRGLSDDEVVKLSADPFLLARPEPRFYIPGTGPSGINGTLSSTEQGDTISMASALAITGAASVAESADTSAATGTLALAAVLSKTEDADTIAATGVLSVETLGAAAITEADDTLAATGAAVNAAALAVTEAGDTLGATSTLRISATASISEAGDTIASTGALLLTANASVADGADTASGAGFLGSSGSLDAIEADDTVSASSALKTFGAASVQEQDDSIASASNLLVTAIATITDGADTVAGTGTSSSVVAGTLSVTEGDDALASASKIMVSAFAGIVEEMDGISSSAIVRVQATASMAEQDDTSTGFAGLRIVGGTDYVEAGDTLTARGEELSNNVALGAVGWSVLKSRTGSRPILLKVSNA